MTPFFFKTLKSNINRKHTTPGLEGAGSYFITELTRNIIFSVHYFLYIYIIQYNFLYY